VAFYLESCWRDNARQCVCVRMPGSRFTFCLRQATHAVIFLVMSGGLLSPKESRSAAILGRDGKGPFSIAVTRRQVKQDECAGWSLSDGVTQQAETCVMRDGGIDRKNKPAFRPPLRWIMEATCKAGC